VSRPVGRPHVDAKFSNNTIHFFSFLKNLFTFGNKYVKFQAFLIGQNYKKYGGRGK